MFLIQQESFIEDHYCVWIPVSVTASEETAKAVVAERNAYIDRIKKLQVEYHDYSANVLDPKRAELVAQIPPCTEQKTWPRWASGLKITPEMRAEREKIKKENLEAVKPWYDAMTAVNMKIVEMRDEWCKQNNLDRALLFQDVGKYSYEPIEVV